MNNLKDFYKMQNKLFVFLLNTLALASGGSISLPDEISSVNIPKEGRLNFTELASDCGFKAEEIEVLTEDGYMLKLFRIPGKKKPVLLVHGTGDTSNTWVLRGNKSLAITLAREGYDVWAGNIRGNRYGRKHVDLDPDNDKTFWDFSFHEVGYYDWRAMIDRVLQETNETKLCGIAHSQGATSFLVLASLKPEYNEKVELFIGLAPVAFLDHTGPVLSAIAAVGPVLIPALDALGINEVFGDNTPEKNIVQLFCSLGVLTASVCSVSLLGLIGGFDLQATELEFVSTVFAQYPAGASAKTLKHYDQIFLNRKFARYDYGPLMNLRRYGRRTPLEYDLGEVTTKVAIMYGKNDLIASPVDVQRLAKLLPNVVYNKAIENKNWNHVDYLWSNEADVYFCGEVLKLLSKNGW